MLNLLLLAFTLTTLQAYAQCKKCEDLRRYHEAHPEENYEYYEDYLKDQAAKNAAKPSEQEK